MVQKKMKPIVNRKWTKGQRQAPNLKQILTRAKFTTSEESRAMPCSPSRCRTCPIIKETKELIFLQTPEKNLKLEPKWTVPHRT